MATTGNAATRAEQAADVALKATGIAVEAKKQAERHAETAERLAPPDPHQEIVRELWGTPRPKSPRSTCTRQAATWRPRSRPSASTGEAAGEPVETAPYETSLSGPREIPANGPKKATSGFEPLYEALQASA